MAHLGRNGVVHFISQQVRKQRVRKEAARDSKPPRTFPQKPTFCNSASSPTSKPSQSKTTSWGPSTQKREPGDPFQIPSIIIPLPHSRQDYGILSLSGRISGISSVQTTQGISNKGVSYKDLEVETPVIRNGSLGNMEKIKVAEGASAPGLEPRRLYSTLHLMLQSISAL